ncbi:MAG: hypothetical protein ACI977_000682 [Candidatus Nanohaloarchaea archaeon]|jgi:hypothetical protein
MKRLYEIILEALLAGLPLALQVYRKTGNLISAALAFLLAIFIVDRFLINPVRAWENLSLFINPFAISIGTFVTALIYLNYTGTAFGAAKWQALGLSLISMVFGFIFLRYWSAA